LVAVSLIVWFSPRPVNELTRLTAELKATSTFPANIPYSGHLLLYSVVLTLINRYRWWFFATTMAAVLLRLFFVLKLPVVAVDSLIYGDIAKCLINNHMFGLEKVSGWEPTLMRLPGYPFFLAFTFLIFGQDHYFGAMLFQLFFDVLTCFLVADIARRVLCARAARTAFVLAAFCPFLINYAATALTECLEVFFIAAAVDCAIIAWDSELDARKLRWWTMCGVACAGAILLRPDGGLILAGIGLPMILRSLAGPGRRRELLTATLLLGAVSLSPLVPWTIRNWRVFRVFQPLVTSHATDPGEYMPIGWERWFKTWLIDYSSVEEIGFHVSGERIDIGDIPDRAYTSQAQRALVHRLVDQYNSDQQMTPEIDRQFGSMADENIRAHPIRYHLLLPIARTLDMWMRPRSEMLPLDTHFWRILADPHDAWCGIALGLLNFAYVAAATAGAWLLRHRIRHLALLLTYPIVRSLFLATTGAAEQRYTLECYPFVIVLAAGFLTWWQTRQTDLDLSES
jgi:4-amino-4-deoxy-L-arabinose transferase-like glycosyltransferase